MSKKKDPKYDSDLEKTVFSWGIMSTDVTIANVMKKKARGGIRNNFDYILYILYYKPATKEGTPFKHDLPKGVINLRRVKYDEVRIDADTSSIIVPTPKRVFEFKSPEDKVLSKWVRVVKERAEVIAKVHIDELLNFATDVQTVQRLFPKTFNVTPRTKVEFLDKIIEDRTKCGNDLKKWDPYMRKAALFLECYFGQNRNYIDWFVGSEGPSRIMQNVEEDMLAAWKAAVEKAMKAAPETATLRFFREDMEETAQLCDDAVLSIDGINKYSKLFLNPDAYVDQYTKERDMLQRFAASFRAFPSERTVDYRTYRGGVVKGSNGDEFEFGFSSGIIISFKGRCKDVNLIFTTQGPELVSTNDQFGTIMWNTRSWVWYHSKYPHTIRFDLDSKTGMFRFKPSPSKSGKNDGHAYCDWSWENGTLKCINNGKEGKVGPSCGEWRVEGDVPLPAVLLAGMAELIIKNIKSI